MFKKDAWRYLSKRGLLNLKGNVQIKSPYLETQNMLLSCEGEEGICHFFDLQACFLYDCGKETLHSRPLFIRQESSSSLPQIQTPVDSFSFSVICPTQKRQGRSEVNPLCSSVRKSKKEAKKGYNARKPKEALEIKPLTIDIV